MKIAEKRRKFLEDEINYRKSNPRSIAENRCVYSPGGGKGCAIGRYLSPKLAYQCDEENEGADTSIKEVIDRLGKKVFPTSLLELGVTFLSIMQKLHDVNQYWIENAADGVDLTEAGESFRDSIIEDFC